MRAKNRKFSQALRGSRGAAQKIAKSAHSQCKKAELATPTEFRKSERTGTPIFGVYGSEWLISALALC